MRRRFVGGAGRMSLGLAQALAEVGHLPRQRVDLEPLRGYGLVQRVDGLVLKRQPHIEHDPVVEYKTFAAPAALCFRNALEISEDAALDVIDLRKTPREQIGAGLFAANSAGAKHRNP